MPRPAYVPPDDIHDKVREWIAAGNTQSSIHKALGICQSTWLKIKRNDPKLVEAIKDGKVSDELACMNRLRRIAFDDKHKGNLTALIFYGKINFGWNDGTRVDKSLDKPSKIKFNVETKKEDS